MGKMELWVGVFENYYFLPHTIEQGRKINKWEKKKKNWFCKYVTVCMIAHWLVGFSVSELSRQHKPVKRLVS